MFKGFHRFLEVRKAAEIQAALGVRLACPLDEFKERQVLLAEMFDGDPKVCDLPRVMRLPGFLHQKGEPFLSVLMKPEE